MSAVTSVPLVSVLMPARNASRWIEESIRNVMTQTWQDWELLVLTDVESTDNTVEIVRRFDDARVRLVLRPHEGLIRALNAGLELARGKYIARIDADDVAAPNWLSSQLGVFELDEKVVLVGGAFLEESPEGWTVVQLPADDIMIRWRRLFSNVIPHSGSMYLREAAVGLGGYDLNAQAAEDYDLWWRLGKIGKYAAVPNVVVRIRKHAESMSVNQLACQLETLVQVAGREIGNVVGSRPEPSMVRSMLHVCGWQMYLPLEMSVPKAWINVLSLFVKARRLVMSTEERRQLDQGEGQNLYQSVRPVLEACLVRDEGEAKELYKAMISAVPGAIPWRQRIRYRVLLVSPRSLLRVVRQWRINLSRYCAKRRGR